MPNVSLSMRIAEFASDESLAIEDCVLGVHSTPAFCRSTHQPLGIRKGNTRWNSTIAKAIMNDVYASILPYTHARVCCSQIDAHSSVGFGIIRRKPPI
mmetsp:Transcript_87365/g.151260  ORF Transcript_87365/g.151260 Transcript_87365/m.151260 type:complete len:98 (-) Transcript_87365:1360-1653(-)